MSTVIQASGSRSTTAPPASTMGVRGAHTQILPAGIAPRAMPASIERTVNHGLRFPVATIRSRRLVLAPNGDQAQPHRQSLSPVHPGGATGRLWRDRANAPPPRRRHRHRN